MNNKQKFGYMALGEPGPVVEANYEIVPYHVATTGYILVDSPDRDGPMQNWTIRFDKPPHGLRVKNALEYTLFDTELHIVAHSSKLIDVLWDEGKKIFACPFHAATGHATDQGIGSIAIGDSSSSFPAYTGEILIKFNTSTKFVVDIKDVTIQGVEASEIDSIQSSMNNEILQWVATVELPADREVTVKWTLTNGIRGSKKVRKWR